jgi:hypothetical protein
MSGRWRSAVELKMLLECFLAKDMFLHVLWISERLNVTYISLAVALVWDFCCYEYP